MASWWVTRIPSPTTTRRSWGHHYLLQHLLLLCSELTAVVGGEEMTWPPAISSPSTTTPDSPTSIVSLMYPRDVPPLYTVRRAPTSLVQGPRLKCTRWEGGTEGQVGTRWGGVNGKYRGFHSELQARTAHEMSYGQVTRDSIQPQPLYHTYYTTTRLPFF